MVLLIMLGLLWLGVLGVAVYCCGQHGLEQAGLEPVRRTAGKA
jgi:hypothetical protein